VNGIPPSTEHRFTLLDRFAQPARERPEAVAIDSGDTQVTYAALAARVAAVARSLREAGCGTGDVVATWVSDRAALVSAMLGAWSAGGVFAPLHTDAPEDRTRQLLDRRRALHVDVGADRGAQSSIRFASGSRK